MLLHSLNLQKNWVKCIPNDLKCAFRFLQLRLLSFRIQIKWFGIHQLDHLYVTGSVTSFRYIGGPFNSQPSRPTASTHLQPSITSSVAATTHGRFDLP